MSFCPECGRPRGVNSRFCGGCGRDFGQPAADGETASAAEPFAAAPPTAVVPPTAGPPAAAPPVPVPPAAAPPVAVPPAAESAETSRPPAAEPGEPATLGPAEPTRWDVPVAQTRLDSQLDGARPGQYPSWYAEPSPAGDATPPRDAPADQ